MLKRTQLDLQKTFPDVPRVSRIASRPFSAARRYERMPQHPFRYRMRWERHWSTGNVGISTAYRFSIMEVLRIVHTIYHCGEKIAKLIICELMSAIS